MRGQLPLPTVEKANKRHIIVHLAVVAFGVSLSSRFKTPDPSIQGRYALFVKPSAHFWLWRNRPIRNLRISGVRDTPEEVLLFLNAKNPATFSGVGFLFTFETMRPTDAALGVTTPNISKLYVFVLSVLRIRKPYHRFMRLSSLKFYFSPAFFQFTTILHPGFF